LVKYVENIGNLDYNINGEKFKDMFLRYCNTTSEGTDDNLKMHAFVYYRKGDAILNKTLEDTDLSTGRDNAVRVTRFVYLPGGSSDDGSSGDQIVLVEVLLWRE
ncbi:MAG: hypothetical protein KO206_03285, partial [Methanomicrobiaceae archaeon]|nr:hypothetical protein [Methanomicrobiaceae archaeon]